MQVNFCRLFSFCNFYILVHSVLDLCINSTIKQLFIMVTSSFSYSTFLNKYEESHLKNIQHLVCSFGMINDE